MENQERQILELCTFLSRMRPTDAGTTPESRTAVPESTDIDNIHILFAWTKVTVGSIHILFIVDMGT